MKYYKFNKTPTLDINYVICWVASSKTLVTWKTSKYLQSLWVKTHHSWQIRYPLWHKCSTRGTTTSKHLIDSSLPLQCRWNAIEFHSFHKLEISHDFRCRKYWRPSFFAEKSTKIAKKRRKRYSSLYFSVIPAYPHSFVCAGFTH